MYICKPNVGKSTVDVFFASSGKLRHYPEEAICIP